MGFVLFLVVGTVVFYFVFQKGKENQAKWREAAEHLGLGYYPGEVGTIGKITGIKDGYRISISAFSQNNGNNSNVFTRYEIHFSKSVGTDFRIVRQTALHRAQAFLGFKDIEVGDVSFDQRALVRGTHADAIIEFLTKPRREAVLRLLDAYEHVEIADDRIKLEKPGKDRETHTLYSTNRMLLSVANELTDDPFTLAEEPVEDFPENPSDEKSTEADFVEAWDEEKEAEEEGQYIEPVEPAFDALTSANPVVPEPAMVEPEPVIEEPVVEDAVIEPVEEEQDESEEEPVAADASINLETLATDLYGGDSSAMLKADNDFEEKFAGQFVSGEGVLDRVSRFSYDSIFTGREGVKAFFKLCEIQGAYSKVRVVAEVAYPSGQYEELRSQVGCTLPIAGTIIKQNKSLYRFYIVCE